MAAFMQHQQGRKQDSIDLVVWTVYGKLKEIYRTAGSTKKNIKFDYDASGNRVAKHVFNSDSTWVRSEYYIRDAQGNIMSTYQHNIDSTMHYAQTEKHIYGSSMLGIDVKETEMIGAAVDTTSFTHALGYKNFTGSNHLGNVLVTFTDRKIPVDLNTDTIIDGYYPDVIASNDYAPFGAYLTERTFKKGSFPNSFNGKREDSELNLQDYGMRPYNPMERELGWNVDPIASDYPWFSTYQYGSNNPINYIDLDGLEGVRPGIRQPRPRIGYSTYNNINEQRYNLRRIYSPNVLPRGGTTQYRIYEETKIPGGSVTTDPLITRNNLVGHLANILTEGIGNAQEIREKLNLDFKMTEMVYNAYDPKNKKINYDIKFTDPATQKLFEKAQTNYETKFEESMKELGAVAPDISQYDFKKAGELVRYNGDVASYNFKKQIVKDQLGPSPAEKVISEIKKAEKETKVVETKEIQATISSSDGY